VAAAFTECRGRPEKYLICITTVLLVDPEWYYRHPLYVHPEQREFVREALKRVNWGVHPDKKWQESHQRQWKKVLEDPGTYYRGPQAS